MKRLTRTEKSWVLYDWANSVQSTVIATAIFPLWFGQVARNGGLSDTQATFWLGTANTVYAVIIALFAGFLGTLSDLPGNRKRLFVRFWALGVSAVAAMIFVGNDQWGLALLLYILCFLGYSSANIVYDATLPSITTPERMDMVSSLGFGYGYIGGSTIPFVLSLAVIALLSGMNLSNGLPTLGVKFSFALTALWWGLFSIPFIRHLPPGEVSVYQGRASWKAGFHRLVKTFRRIREHKRVVLFLIAYFFYIDGVNTIIKMASNFADSLGVSFMILLGVLVGIQILAFPFTLLYGRLAGRFGAKTMLFVGIGVYTLITALGTAMPLVPEGAVVPVFLTVALLIASSQGGIQALSRSYYASLIPHADSSGEFFGFYNTMGKFAAILGPFLMGALPRFAVVLGLANEKHSYSFGAAAILLLFIVGGVLLARTAQDSSSSV
ncbi:MAG: MFS transporter [Spirochaetales bacterium]|nr:MFS transporter [Spirochaetales bacterium]